jgi:hypothetical protein
MPPDVLSKAIVSSLLLWSMNYDEIIVESLPRSKVGFVDTIKDLNADDSDCILLMESPQLVVCCRVDLFLSTKQKGKGKVFICV